MGFSPATRTGDIVVRAEGLSKAFDRTLFKDLTFDVIRGQRWGILGPNGTGKTTLLKIIVGRLDATAGRVALGTGVKVGYYDQMLTGLPDDAATVEAVRPKHKEFTEPQRRDLLAKFGITGDMAFQPVGSLSGGERSRTALAQLAAQEPNFLVLDEPTNHLDLWACDSLERTLLDFSGTLLFVSHDRYFLNRVATHILVVEPDRFRVFEGNYEAYQRYLQARAAERVAESVAQSDNKATAEPKADVPKKDRRKRKFPYRKTADIEADILEHETQVEQLQAQLLLPETLRDGRLVKQTQGEIDRLQSELAQLYEHWEEAAELNS